MTNQDKALSSMPELPAPHLTGDAFSAAQMRDYGIKCLLAASPQLPVDHIADAGKMVAATVPQVVQAPSLTDDERRALVKVKWSADNLCRTVNLSVDDIKALAAMSDRLAAPQPVAAPIVATVPSEPVAYLVSDPSVNHVKIAVLANAIDHYPKIFTKQPLYAVPISTAAEQASEVRNAAIDECATLAFEEVDLLPIEDTHSAKRGFAKDVRDAILELKSATPADKGNAPAEGES